MFYSPNLNSFFDTDPGDGYQITAERHAELLAGQGEGKTIAYQRDGKPYLKSPPEITPEQQVTIIQANRQRAYEQESDPLYMEWQFDQTADSESAWRSKVEEIKQRYPMPDQ